MIERHGLGRREAAVLVGILLTGALLRGLYLSDLRRDPLFGAPALDAQLHDYWARGLATGDWTLPGGVHDPRIPTTPYFRPPGYAWFLGAVYEIAGDGTPARLVQFGLGLASCVLGFVLGRRWFGGAVGAVLAGWLALYWPLIYFEGQLVDPVLLVFLVLAIVLVLSGLLRGPGVWRAAGAGLLIGVAALVRPNVLVFVPVAVAWIVGMARWRRRRIPTAGDKPVPWAVAGILIGTVVAVSPATLRNWIVAGELVPISCNAGVNLYIGNNPQADGMHASLPDTRELIGKDGWTCFDYPELVRGLSRELGRPLTYAAASRVFARRAGRWILDHPGRFLALTARRAALFWGPGEVEDRDVGLTRRSSPVLRHLPVGFPLLLSFALPGAVLLLLDARRGTLHRAPRRSERASREYSDGTPAPGAGAVGILAASFVAAYSISFLPFFFNARYRVPLVPLLALFAAYAVVRLARFVAAREARRALAWAACCAGVFLVASANLAGYEPREDEWHYQLANAYRGQGQLERAAAEYRETLRLNPSHPSARNDLGVILLAEGKPEEAARAFRSAIETTPRGSDARFNLGNLLVREGKIDQAIAQYRAGLALDPLDVRARIALGSALLLHGDAEAAMREYVEARRLRPDEPMVHVALGRALLRRGSFEASSRELGEALALEPADPLAHSLLGDVLARMGRPEEAAAHYREALRLEPRFAPAARGLEKLRSPDGPAPAPGRPR